MADAITVPGKLQMIIGEQLNLTVDFANLVPAGDVVSSPTLVIENSATNELANSALRGVPSVSNNTVINVTINSTTLRRGSSYTATFSGTSTGAGTSKVVGAVLILEIVY